MQTKDQPDNLTERDIKVLMALEELPLGTFEDIARLTGFAKSGVFNIYQRLSFHLKGEIPICSVCATPNIVSLGLEIADVLVDLAPSTPIEYLEELCFEHPYTLYFAPAYGALNGVLIQFRIPLGTRAYIRTLFQELRSRGKIENFKMLVFPWNPLYTTTRIGKTNAYYWNHAALKWDYDLLAWFQEIETENVDNYSKFFQAPFITPNSALKWLKKSDLYILVELMDNARKKNIDLMNLILEKRKVEFTRQTFSRRLKKIEKECVIGHRVQIKARILDIHSPTLLIGEGSEKYIQQLAMHLKNDPIPFTSTFKHDKNTIFWYIHLPATHLADLLYSLRRNLTQLQVSIMDHPRSHGFYIYSDAYDENSKSWNQSEKFMVNSVLEYMAKWEKKAFK
ncbi:MAG: hypothetical protein ACTSRK_00255 [Promethearchaeota archaeon]